MQHRSAPYSLGALALALGLVLSGCTSPQSGTSLSQGAGASETADGIGETDPADIDFIQEMVLHERNGVRLSNIMLSKPSGLDTRILDVVNRAKSTEEAELDVMESWLASRGEPELDPASQDPGVENVPTPEDFAELEKAQGRQAAHLFLSQMVLHQQAIVDLAKEVVANSSNQAMVDLAVELIVEREARIDAMKRMLPAYEP